jgi:mannose-6-phosphate isomerase
MKIEMMKYYKFEPLLKTLIWGTENWVISGVEGSETKSNGQPLNTLLRELKADLVGKANYKRFGDEFPLFIKFINAETDLSIQVHPDDGTARRQGLSHGKTEMWFIMDSEPDASIYTGIKKQLTREEYKQKVANNTICDALALYQVKEGDCFFIPAGRIHAIRSGCRLAEIQQTSDVTYRIYDYDRRDKDGQPRQLHIKEAAESIDFHVLPDYQTHYEPHQNESQLLIECPYFNTAVYDLTEPMQIDYSDLDSFIILIGLKGEGLLSVDGEEVAFKGGEAILLPATVQEVRVEGTLKFLETYVLSE